VSAGSARELGVAILGAGFGRIVHLPGFERLAGEGVRVVGVAAHEDDWRALALRDDVHLVSVTTPPFLHREQSLAALEAGKAALCEKPLAIDGEEATALVAAAERAGVATLVDFEFREHPAFRRAHTLLADGAIGDVERVELSWRLPARAAQQPSWKDRTELGGGTLLSLGVHAFDYLDWLVAPAAHVRASLYAPTEEGRTADHGCIGTLELTNGVEVALDLCSVATEGVGHRLAFTGSRGTLTLRNDEPFDYLGDFALTVAGRPVELEPRPRDDDGRLAPFTELARRLVRAVRDGGRAEPSFEAGLRAQRCADAVRESDRTGDRKPVAV